MNKMVEIKGTGVVGVVVARVKGEKGPILAVDVNGEGGIFYVDAFKTKAFDPTK